MKKITYMVIAMIAGNYVANKLYRGLWDIFGE